MTTHHIRIGIIGNGVVGNATGKALESHVDEVRYWDAVDAKCSHSLHDTVCGTDLVFVCLPTPQCKDSLACDISVVDEFFQHMSGLSPNSNFVLRSTVPVGFTRMMCEKYGLNNLVHSPEFLTARTAEEDAKNPTRLLVGGEVCDCRTLVCKLYDRVWGTGPDSCDKFVMTSNESEFVKLMQNSFSAIKISAFNEFRRFSDAKGMDWEWCLVALLAGGWINPMHTQVPGPDGKMGFGGSCLPKDLSNLLECMYPNAEGGASQTSICAAAYRRNKYLDRKEK